MLKGSFDARLIFLSELNMRFDVTACACGVNQYPNSIYDTTDHFFCLFIQYNDSYSFDLVGKQLNKKLSNMKASKQCDLIHIYIFFFTIALSIFSGISSLYFNFETVILKLAKFIFNMTWSKLKKIGCTASRAKRENIK